MRQPVVITGIGCISSFGVGTAPFIDGLLDGRTGIAPIARFGTDGCRSHKAALVQGFDPAVHIDPLKLRRIDEVGRLALATCRLAIEDAGLPTGTDEVGVALGTATSGLHSTVEHLQALTTRGPSAVSALSFSNTVGNASASLCAIEFGLRGPNVTLTHKQASSLAALVYAVRTLGRGALRAFVTGGVDDFEETFFRVHDRLRVLARAHGTEEASRPFDRRRNGFVLGAGGHLLVVETTASARARSARTYAEILGVADGASPCTLNGWPADGSGIARVMRAALADATLGPADVAAVFASANSSQGLDAAEAQAIDSVFGPLDVPVVSLKGAIGEFGASGAAAVTAAALSLARGLLPPTAGCDQPDPGCPVNVSATTRPGRPGVAIVNGTAGGGAHYSLVIRAL